MPVAWYPFEPHPQRQWASVASPWENDPSQWWHWGRYSGGILGCRHPGQLGLWWVWPPLGLWGPQHFEGLIQEVDHLFQHDRVGVQLFGVESHTLAGHWLWIGARPPWVKVTPGGSLPIPPSSQSWSTIELWTGHPALARLLPLLFDWNSFHCYLVSKMPIPISPPHPALFLENTSFPMVGVVL